MPLRCRGARNGTSARLSGPKSCGELGLAEDRDGLARRGASCCSGMSGSSAASALSATASQSARATLAEMLQQRVERDAALARGLGVERGFGGGLEHALDDRRASTAVEGRTTSTELVRWQRRQVERRWRPRRSRRCRRRARRGGRSRGIDQRIGAVGIGSRPRAPAPARSPRTRCPRPCPCLVSVPVT